MTMIEDAQVLAAVGPPLEPSVSPQFPARELTFEKPAAWRAPALSAFVKQHHYSKACPPGMHWFSAWHGAELVGVMLFRKPSLPKTGAAYECDLELSRVVLLDKAGKNSESRFIGWALRWLKKHTDKRAVISFADPRFGHVGTIYKASNWQYLGREKGHGTRRIVVDGEWLHSKTAYDRWGMSGANLIAHLAPRKVEVVVCPPKNVYRYCLRANVAIKRGT
jgi:hypothetical protein